MAAFHRSSPLRVSDTEWFTSKIIGNEGGDPPTSSSLDLVPAPRASDLQIILRTRDHAAYYDPTSNELSLQKFEPPQSLEASTSETSPKDALLVPHRIKSTTSQSLLQRFPSNRALPRTSSHNDAICPTCARPWPLPASEPLNDEYQDDDSSSGLADDSPSFMAPNYFRLLAQATSTSSANPTRPSTPALPRNRFSSASGTSTPDPYLRSSSPSSDPIPSSSELPGYYSRFFLELKPLGRGARGTVFLCQHILNGNPLGKYAIKKIPVGDHAQSLLQSLNEVHLMESFHHPHLIHYQHAWIERWKSSKFAPEVPTLFVLMMAANGGSLADWISARAGEKVDASGSGSNTSDKDSTAVDAGVGREELRGKGLNVGQQSGSEAVEDAAQNPAERRKIERLKEALRQRRRAHRQPSLSSPSMATTSANGTNIDTDTCTAAPAIHLLREDEIYSLLTDITSGLSFLHDRGILHLDIKPGNILLHWDDDSLLPRAMLSDFGSSLLLHDSYSRTRSGHTGTMEYMSPETVLVDSKTGKLAELSSKADIWSLGMILHLLLFFRLPFSQTEDVDSLREEMASYRGFHRQREKERGERGDEVLLGLLERMLCVDPVKRPSCREILQVLSTRHAEEAGQRDKKQQARRARGHGDGDKEFAEKGGVSLALYRPAALPPLRSPPRIDDHNFGEPPLTLATLKSRLLYLLPPEALPIGMALVKCLSPSLLSRFTTSSPPRQEVLPTDSTGILILILALIDLSNSLTSQKQELQSGRSWRYLSMFCWITHLALLLHSFVVVKA